MAPSEVVKQFNMLSLGDSMLELVELRTGEATCRLRFDSGRVLKSTGASIFDPAAEFAPALLKFEAIRSISCDGAEYQLNSTVVDFGATISKIHNYVDFYFDLTGGTDPDAFLVKLRIVAERFAFGAWEE